MYQMTDNENAKDRDMARILNTVRLFVAAIAVIAIVGAPFVIMNTKTADASAGYGVQAEKSDILRRDLEANRA